MVWNLGLGKMDKGETNSQWQCSSLPLSSVPFFFTIWTSCQQQVHTANLGSLLHSAFQIPSFHFWGWPIIKIHRFASTPTSLFVSLTKGHDCRLVYCTLVTPLLCLVPRMILLKYTSSVHWFWWSFKVDTKFSRGQNYGTDMSEECSLKVSGSERVQRCFLQREC